MILVDTSVIVAWLDPSHPDHSACTRALEYWAGEDRLAVSSVSYAEMAAGGRTREAVDADLAMFERVDLDFEGAWQAGLAFGRATPKKGERLVLPDFLIRGQARALACRHLTEVSQLDRFFGDFEVLGVRVS